jgi:hypothetical protein
MLFSKNRTRSPVYRKIYEQHYGPIPKDDEGRTFEIHHKDGDTENNDPANLVALSIKDHYDLHYSQGDWSACLAMSHRMKISPEEKSELARENSLRQFKNGTSGLAKWNANQGWGKLHDSSDKTIYCFEHTKTKERVYSTRYEFYKKYKMAAHQLALLIYGHHRTVYGWALITTNSDGSETNSDKQNKLKDHTIYTFRNRVTGEIVNMTRSELSKTHGVCHRALSKLIKNPNKKRIKDWIIVR